MKKRIVLISILLLLWGSMIFAKSTIIIANGEWPPFSGEKLPYYGICSRMVTDIFEVENVKVEYKFVPWIRAIELTKLGKYYDAVIEFSKNKERLEKFYFSEKPILRSKMVLFHKKDYEFSWENLEDLSEKRIGGTNGYYYIEGLETIKAYTDEINFKNLLLNRIDLFACDLEVGKMILKEKFKKEERDKIIYDEKPLKIKEYYFLVSKKHPRAKEIMEKFNSGMEKIIKSGRYQQYYDDLAEGKYK